MNIDLTVLISQHFFGICLEVDCLVLFFAFVPVDVVNVLVDVKFDHVVVCYGFYQVDVWLVTCVLCMPKKQKTR